jgi:hypothetical protein
MLPMPYVLLGGFGYLVYRAFKRQSQAQSAATGAARAGGGKDLSCSDLSTDVTS